MTYERSSQSWLPHHRRCIYDFSRWESSGEPTVRRCSSTRSVIGGKLLSPSKVRWHCGQVYCWSAARSGGVLRLLGNAGWTIGFRLGCAGTSAGGEVLAMGLDAVCAGPHEVAVAPSSYLDGGGSHATPFPVEGTSSRTSERVCVVPKPGACRMSGARSLVAGTCAVAGGGTAGGGRKSGSRTKGTLLYASTRI